MIAIMQTKSPAIFPFGNHFIITIANTMNPIVRITLSMRAIGRKYSAVGNKKSKNPIFTPTIFFHV